MEHYIKDHKRFLHSDRMSCHKFEANQFRVFLHSAAYVFMHTLRAQGLRGTAWSRAQFDQMQLRVLKMGARREEWKTKTRFHFPSSFPLNEVYARVLANLSGIELCRSPSWRGLRFARLRLIRGDGAEVRISVRPLVGLESTWKGVETGKRVTIERSKEAKRSSGT